MNIFYLLSISYLSALMTTEYRQIEARIERAVAYQSDLGSKPLLITVLATTFDVPY
jgi:hypothetical protein